MCKCLSCHFKLPCKCINLEQHLFSTDLATESSPLDLFNAFCSIYCSPSFVAPLRGCQDSAGQSSWQEVSDPRFSLLKHSPNTTCSFRSILKQASNFKCMRHPQVVVWLVTFLSSTPTCFWDQGWSGSSGSSGLW